MIETRFPDAPPQIAALKLDERGYPVPWFVPWVDGQPDFIRVDPRRIMKSHNEHRCWICGVKLGTSYYFTIGPMCAVNRVSAEPPQHLTCARFAVRSCPFLSRPLAKRPPRTEPYEAPAGTMITRNPGVVLIWGTKTYRMQRERDAGLFYIGAPTLLEWYREGRTATRAEIMDSIRTGLPALADIAQQEGAGAVAELDKLLARALKLVPAT